MGYDVNIIFGNPGNYVGSGFVSCRKKRVSCFQKGNYPTALLVCELIPGVLDGHEWMPSQEEFYIYSHSSVVRE